MRDLRRAGERRRRQGLALHYVMTALGGYVGFYTVALFFHNFPLAQTGYFLSAVHDFCSGDGLALALRFLSLVLYVGGMALALILQPSRPYRARWICLAALALALVLVPLLQQWRVPALLALAPLVFSFSMQFICFTGTERFYASSTFCTNNLKQLTIALVAVCYFGDRSQLPRLAFYASCILDYVLAALISAGLLRLFTYWSLPLALPLLALAAFLLRRERTLEEGGS